MHLDVPLKTLFTVDPVAFAAIKDKVESIKDEGWDMNPYRQRAFSVHSQTRSIILKFQAMNSGPVTKDITVYPTWHEWSELLAPIMEQVAEELTGCNDGVIVKALLAELPAGCSIAPHADTHRSFNKAHRIHIPIVTNDEVDFMIGGQVYHMEEGVVYDMNNKLAHSVKNNSDTGRVHLIFDYVPGEAWKNWGQL